VWTVDVISRQLPGLVTYLNPARAPDRNPANRPQRISDLVRFKILFEFGGICIEPDIRALNKSLDELISVVQQDGGAAFSVCREVNQFHPDKTQRPMQPPPGVFHGESDLLSRKCHRVDSAVICAPQGDGAIKQAYETAIVSMDAARSDDEFGSPAQDMTIAWTRILRERRARNQDAHWRILASRTFFGIGCTRTSSSSRGKCEGNAADAEHVYGIHFFDMSSVPSLLDFNSSDTTRSIATHIIRARETRGKSGSKEHIPARKHLAQPRCFPLDATCLNSPRSLSPQAPKTCLIPGEAQDVLAEHKFGMNRDQRAAYRFNISVLYHDERSRQRANVLERCPWGMFRLMEQSVYFESMAILSYSGTVLASGQHDYVGFMPYSILNKQRCIPSNASLDALVECSVVGGSRRNASELPQTRASSRTNGR